jgi:hypothetical protein
VEAVAVTQMQVMLAAELVALVSLLFAMQILPQPPHQQQALPQLP